MAPIQFGHFGDKPSALAGNKRKIAKLTTVDGWKITCLLLDVSTVNCLLVISPMGCYGVLMSNTCRTFERMFVTANLGPRSPKGVDT